MSVQSGSAQPGVVDEEAELDPDALRRRRMLGVDVRGVHQALHGPL